MAQCVVPAIGGDRIGEPFRRSRIDQRARLAIRDQAGASGRAGSDHGQATRHCFERDVPKGFGDRGVEEDIGAGQRSTEVRAGLKTGEDRLRHRILEPGARRTVADHQHLVRHTPFAQEAHSIGEHAEPFLHDEPSEKRDGDVAIFEPEFVAPLRIALRGIEYRPIDAARPDRHVVMHVLIVQRVDHALRRRHQCVALAVDAA